MSFVNRMKEARLKSGLTQEKLAKAIGVAKSTYTGYEKGNSEPNMLVLSKIMDTLGVDANYLFQDEVQMQYDMRASPLEMEKLVKKYRPLDAHGKEAVDSILDIEYKRYQAEHQARTAEKTNVAAELTASRNDMEAAEEIEYFTIPIYNMPLSAGTGQEAGQEYPEDFLLKKRPPRGTSYIAHICGDSMEPTYHDGDLVFIYSTLDIDVGQIGAFFMDGQMWVKELGDGVLISHNPDYPPRPMTEDIRCQGLVLGVCDDSYFE